MESTIKTTCTKKQVEELIERENLAYQKINLPFGLTTAGRDRSQTSAKIFAHDFKGKSVLDIGCFLGYFCHEAVRRGAGRVVGIDVDENRLRQARLLAECLNLPIEYQRIDIEQDDPPGQFDIILLLNVLHHIRNPISLLDKLTSHTRERLIMEIAGPESPQADELLKLIGASWLTRRRINKLPLIVVGRDQTITKKNEQKFFFSFPALKHLLIEQRGSYARLDLINSHFKNRYIAVAWKLRIENLIIVGGPTAAGKSTLLKRLLNQKICPIAAAIGMQTDNPWMGKTPSSLKETGQEKIENLLYHYDLLRPWGNDARTYEREQGLDVLDCARVRKVITLWCEPKTMRRRLEDELKTVKRHWHRQRIKDVLDLYHDGKRLAERLLTWTDYCKHKGAQLLFIDCTGEPQMLSLADWERKIQNLQHDAI